MAYPPSDVPWDFLPKYIVACREAQMGEAYHNPVGPPHKFLLGGHGFSRAERRQKSRGFNPCGHKCRCGTILENSDRVAYSGLLITPHAIRGGAPLPVSLATA